MIVRGWGVPTSYLFFSVVQTISFIYNYSEHKEISYIRSCLYAVFQFKETAMKDVIKVTIEVDDLKDLKKAAVTVALDEELLDHAIKTGKLTACRRIVERIPELRDALVKLLEERFFSYKKSAAKE